MLIRDLRRGFVLDLEARNRQPSTRDTYLKALDQFEAFLTEHGHSTEATEVTANDVRSWIAWLNRNRAPATAAQRFRSLQQFWRWAVEEGEVDASPMDKLKPPQVPDVPIAVLSDAELKALLDACKGRGFAEVRDTAIIRVFIDTGARLSEVTDRELGDVDLDRRELRTITKGGHLQVKYLGARATQALDRYLRARVRHRHGGLPWLWLGARGRLTNSGVTSLVKRRAAQAGIGHVHPHQLRHTFADRWLSEGGNEGDLVRLMGWKDRQMLERYAASTAQARARDAHQRLGLGDRL